MSRSMLELDGDVGVSWRSMFCSSGWTLRAGEFRGVSKNKHTTLMEFTTSDIYCWYIYCTYGIVMNIIHFL
jgi:hypothetical protein